VTRPFNLATSRRTRPTSQATADRQPHLIGSPRPCPSSPPSAWPASIWFKSAEYPPSPRAAASFRRSSASHSARRCSMSAPASAPAGAAAGAAAAAAAAGGEASGAPPAFEYCFAAAIRASRAALSPPPPPVAPPPLLSGVSARQRQVGGEGQGASGARPAAARRGRWVARSGSRAALPRFAVGAAWAACWLSMAPVGCFVRLLRSCLGPLTEKVGCENCRWVARGVEGKKELPAWCCRRSRRWPAKKMEKASSYDFGPMPRLINVPCGRWQGAHWWDSRGAGVAALVHFAAAGDGRHLLGCRPFCRPWSTL
jgi:hypothetical protein